MKAAGGDGVEQLLALASFGGTPAAFWPAFLEGVAGCLHARRVLLIARQEGSWRIFQHYPPRSTGSEDESRLVQQLAETAVVQGHGQLALGEGLTALATRLALSNQVATPIDASLLVALLPGSPATAGLDLLRLAGSVPACYELYRQNRQGLNKAERLYHILTLATGVSQQGRFMQALLMLCNEIASRWQCDRVSLGWLQGHHVRLRAISHMEQFEARMAVCQQLETIMEEALDQDEAVCYPPLDDSRVVGRGHELYARTQGVDQVLSLPLHLADRPLAVVTVERSGSGFTASDLLELRLLGEGVMGVLHLLQQRDRWWGARLASGLKQKLDALWGVEHSLAKLAAVGVSVILLVISLVTWPYRIEAPFTLRSQDMAFVSAPFDGYLQDVYAEIGDLVEEGTPLATLDSHELLLEQASVAADVTRYGREAEKAQSMDSLADMQIAASRRDQSLARLELLRHNLSRAKVLSPMAGFVVEGNLKEKLAAPVRKGDLLFKVARIEKTFAELEIPEMDIHEVVPGSRGEIAFVGRPDKHFAVQVSRLEPVATLKGGKNVFLARTTMEEDAQEWWRPGMGGTAKLDAGDRPILWILTHRTLRFLQKVFWL